MLGRWLTGECDELLLGVVGKLEDHVVELQQPEFCMAQSLVAGAERLDLMFGPPSSGLWTVGVEPVDQLVEARLARMTGGGCPEAGQQRRGLGLPFAEDCARGGPVNVDETMLRCSGSSLLQSVHSIRAAPFAASTSKRRPVT